jgi:uncharacterized pyridoxamine 5'-phosphate oxidase family protein
MDIQKEILIIIENSRLEPTHRSLWEIFLAIISEEQAQEIMELLKSHPDHVYFLTENIKEKFWAMKKLDKKSMDGIIAKEKDYLLKW